MHEHRSYRCGTHCFRPGSERSAIRSISQEAVRTTIMLATVLGAVLPMVVTVLLGFVAAWHHDFGSKDAPILNRMVLVYAVPLALFAGTVTTSRAQLSQDIPLVIALCVSIIGLYGVVLLLCRWTFRLPMNISAPAAPTVISVAQ